MESTSEGLLKSLFSTDPHWFPDARKRTRGQGAPFLFLRKTMSMKVSANPLQNAAGRALVDLPGYSAIGKRGRGGDRGLADYL